MNSERPSNSLTILARTGRPWMNAWRISPGCRLRDMRCSWCSQRLYWPTTMATAWTYYGQSLFASPNIGRLRFPRGQWWDRPAIPFHVVLQFEPDADASAMRRWGIKDDDILQ